jgi:hypothetical protein
MPDSQPKKAPSLEREAIMAVVVLYMLITIVVLIFHYLPLEEHEGAANTSSPLHQEETAP